MRHDVLQTRQWLLGQVCVEAHIPRAGAAAIRSVLDLRNADAETIRSRFSVVTERTVRELRGVSCLALEAMVPDKQQIMSSRSFGRYVYERQALEEAVATYVGRAAEKLRRQDALAGALMVHIRTNPFSENEPQYQKALTIALPQATANRYGRGTLRVAAEGTGAAWRMKRERLSPGYTTDWAGLAVVTAR